jgi:hypothetical protein
LDGAPESSTADTTVNCAAFGGCDVEDEFGHGTQTTIPLRTSSFAEADHRAQQDARRSGWHVRGRRGALTRALWDAAGPSPGNWVQPISDDATLGLPLSVPQRSDPDTRFESSLPSHFPKLGLGLELFKRVRPRSPRSARSWHEHEHCHNARRQVQERAELGQRKVQDGERVRRDDGPTSCDSRAHIAIGRGPHARARLSRVGPVVRRSPSLALVP